MSEVLCEDCIAGDHTACRHEGGYMDYEDNAQRCGCHLTDHALDNRPKCWYGDGLATCEYWFEPQQEWRPLCASHEMVAVGNLPPHYIRLVTHPN